jgi:mRNA-degrading endonuclease RelE of RelBE toxin-antitoxin system
MKVIFAKSAAREFRRLNRAIQVDVENNKMIILKIGHRRDIYK